MCVSVILCPNSIKLSITAGNHYNISEISLNASAGGSKCLAATSLVGIFRQRVCKMARHTSHFSCILQSHVSRPPDRNPERASNPHSRYYCVIAINDFCSSFTLLAFLYATITKHRSVPLKGKHRSADSWLCLFTAEKTSYLGVQMSVLVAKLRVVLASSAMLATACSHSS